MKSSTFRPLLILTVFVLTTLACGLGSRSSAEETAEVERIVQQTLSVERTQLAGSAAAQEEQPTDSPQPSQTPTPQPPATSSTPMVQVSQNTNCRTGPGVVYDQVMVLFAGESAEIVARSSAPNYVVIAVPGDPGRSCWLWLQYAQIEGSTSGLEELAPPPTPTLAPSPTPEVNFNLSYAGSDNCVGTYRVFIRIDNTGILNIESYEITAVDQDAQVTFTNQLGYFIGSASCNASITLLIIPGSTEYAHADYQSPVSGHDFQVTLTGCNNEGSESVCRTKSISFHVP